MYQEVKDRLEERVNTKVISHTSVFRGKFICPKCDGVLTMNTNTRKTKKGYITHKSYYCDSCKSRKESFAFTEKALDVFYDYLARLDLEQYKVQEKTIMTWLQLISIKLWNNVRDIINCMQTA